MHREEWRKEMLAEMQAFPGLPRHVYEAFPSLVNRFMNCETWDEVIFGLKETYYSEETKIFFAFFCGELLERIERDAKEAVVVAKAEKLARQIMATIGRIEQKLGAVEGQHKDILELADRIKTGLEE